MLLEEMSKRFERLCLRIKKKENLELEILWHALIQIAVVIIGPGIQLV